MEDVTLLQKHTKDHAIAYFRHQDISYVMWFDQGIKKRKKEKVMPLY